MAANIHGKMVYSFNQPMWHAITEPSTVPMTAVEVIDNKFGGGFGIEIRPMFGFVNGDMGEQEGYNIIVRTASPYDQKEVVFGTCTDRYHPMQPREVAAMFDIKVLEFVETMGFLGDGEEMFVSWKMPAFDVREGDGVDMYGIIRTGFNTLKGTKLFTATVRPVCQNTCVMAEAWARQNSDGKGKGMVWTGKGTNPNLLNELGSWLAHVQTQAIREASLVQGFFQKLAATPIKSDAEAKGLIFQAYPDMIDASEYWPSDLKGKKKADIEDFNKSQERVRSTIERLYMGEGTAITPDGWGLMNATTEAMCHYLPSKKPIAESVMFGGRQELTMKMVNVLKEWSK